MKLAHDLIAEQFDLSLDGAGDKRVGFLTSMERQLAAIGDPVIEWHVESGDTGFLRALAGQRRDVLRIRDTRFPEYVVVIYARSRGSILRASWLLVVAPTLRKDIRRAVRAEGGRGRFDVGAELDYFGSTDLSDFVAITRLAFGRAAKEIAGADDPSDTTVSHVGAR